MTSRPAAQRIDWVDPEVMFLGGPAREPRAFWLDAGPRAASGWSWLGVGDPAMIAPRSLALAAAGATVPGGLAGGWVGWLGYDDGAGRAGAPSVADSGAPGEAGLSVRRLIAFDHGTGEAWVIAPQDELADAVAQASRWRALGEATRATASATASIGTCTANARHTPHEYAGMIERCRQAIRAGDAYQLCLTTRFEVATGEEPLDPVEVYLRLRHDQPAHHGGFIRVGEHALLSSSPEQFLHVADGVVRTRPIKGTRPRGDTPASDAALARELSESAKERAENVMIVDLMRNDLQRVCAPGSVAAERLLEVETYPAVHQLVSTVAGRLLPGTTVGDLLDAAFPAGSMTGAPKLSAMTILHALEGGPRGVFGGCFGWVGHDGRLDLAMTIRSIVVHRGGAYVGAGGGITWLSVAADEVAEVALKARAPLAALGVALPGAWATASTSGP